ncbi:MAG: hypothetical protein V9G13_14735 [Marmoricola sp.]
MKKHTAASATEANAGTINRQPDAQHLEEDAEQGWCDKPECGERELVAVELRQRDPQQRQFPSRRAHPHPGRQNPDRPHAEAFLARGRLGGGNQIGVPGWREPPECLGEIHLSR